MGYAVVHVHKVKKQSSKQTKVHASSKQTNKQKSMLLPNKEILQESDAETGKGACSGKQTWKGLCYLMLLLSLLSSFCFCCCYCHRCRFVFVDVIIIYAVQADRPGKFNLIFCCCCYCHRCRLVFVVVIFLYVVLVWVQTCLFCIVRQKLSYNFFFPRPRIHASQGRGREHQRLKQE